MDCVCVVFLLCMCVSSKEILSFKKKEEMRKKVSYFFIGKDL